MDDGWLVTPGVEGTGLDGVTRRWIEALPRDRGYEVTERPLALDEWCEGAAHGRIVEAFACGTAAMVTPINGLVWANGGTTLAAPRADGPGDICVADRPARYPVRPRARSVRLDAPHRLTIASRDPPAAARHRLRLLATP